MFNCLQSQQEHNMLLLSRLQPGNRSIYLGINSFHAMSCTHFLMITSLIFNCAKQKQHTLDVAWCLRPFFDVAWHVLMLHSSQLESFVLLEIIARDGAAQRRRHWPPWRSVVCCAMAMLRADIYWSKSIWVLKIFKKKNRRKYHLILPKIKIWKTQGFWTYC